MHIASKALAGAVLCCFLSMSAASAATTFNLTAATPEEKRIEQSRPDKPFTLTSTDGSSVASLFAWAYRSGGSNPGIAGLDFGLSKNSVAMTTEGTGSGFNAFEIQENANIQEFLVIQMDTSDWSPVSINFNDSTNGNLSYEVYGTNLLASSADNWRTITDEATGSLEDLSSLTLIAPSLFTNPDNDGTSESLVFDELVPSFQTYVITTGSSGNKFRVTEFQGNPSPVPLPAALPLLASAIGGFGVMVAWKRRKTVA